VELFRSIWQREIFADRNCGNHPSTESFWGSEDVKHCADFIRNLSRFSRSGSEMGEGVYQ
jgi:hypothetical protein